MRLKGKVAFWFYGIMILVAAVEIPIFIVSVWIEPTLFGAALSFDAYMRGIFVPVHCCQKLC